MYPQVRQLAIEGKGIGMKIYGWIAAGVLSLGWSVAQVPGEKVTPNDQVKAAVEEILALSEGLECQEPQAWNVLGSLETAAQFLIEELTRRGWTMLRHGQLSQSYAVVVDPNPEDPKAVAVGGFMPNGSASSSEVFLAQCAVAGDGDGGTDVPLMDERLARGFPSDMGE